MSVTSGRRGTRSTIQMITPPTIRAIATAATLNRCSSIQ
jgi:hypothetical protein